MELKRHKLDTGSLIIASIIITFFIIAVSNVSASISPDYVSYEKEPDECYTEIKTVEIPGTSIEVDVIFAFDLTGSMGEILYEAQSNIESVMDTLISTNTGVSFKFGVISYMDYPNYYESCGYSELYGHPYYGDYAYSLDKPLTNVTTDVIYAIENLSLGNGIDLPEDYTRIFYESYTDTNIGWRTGAQKLLVNFGDNVPHDCDLNESFTSGTWSTGGDPGPDEVMFTGDDLDLQTVLATMASNEITLIECHSSYDYLNYWEYWTGITGGSANYTNVSNFVDVVEDAITNKLTIPKIYDLHLEVTTSGYENWLSSVVPTSYPEVSMGGIVTFEETICVPIGTPPGEYTFVVSALDVDGINYGNQTNVVTINSPPVANDDFASTDEDTSVIIDVLANDTDDGTIDPTTVFVTSGPSDGFTTVNISTGEIEYTPDGDFYGSDSFTYEVDDDDGATSNEATVTITVIDVNDNPIANDDRASTDEDTSVDIDVIANDTDDDGFIDPTTVVIVSDVTNGFTSVHPVTGIVTYIPDPDYYGPDSFNYEVDDNDGGTSNIATVSITINDDNDPPTANDDFASTNEDSSVIIVVLANDTDDDGTINPTTVFVTSGPSDGICNVNVVNGEIEYTPDSDFYGSDSFTYTVDDNDGATSNEAIVTITIENVNDPPIITTTDDTTADEDELYSVDYEATDIDLDILTWSLATDAGFLSIDTNTLSGTPDSSDVGSYYVNVTVDDGNGGTDYSNFTLVVSDVNDPPDAPINPYPADEETGVAKSPTLSVFVTDPEGNVLNVSFYDDEDNLIGNDTGVASGTNASVTWNGLSYSTLYSWYAVANDSEYTTESATWNFTTKKSPSPPPPPPPENNDPVADVDAGAPYIGLIYEDITFDGSFSYDPDLGGYIDSWHWDFDDGTDEYGEIVTHNYSTPGTYTVILTVEDDEGATDWDGVNVVISIVNNPPTNLVVGGPLTGKQNNDYEYTASAIDLDEFDMLRYIFEWGDGTTTTSDVVDSGVIVTVTHNWTSFGIFEVKVTAKDNYSAEISTTFTVLVDVIVIDGEITGLIIDEDGNDPFDIFNNSDTDGVTGVEFDNGSYLIDIDGDKEWDFAYDPDTGLLTYYEFVYLKYFDIYETEMASPGFEFIALLAAIALLAIILRKKKKNN